MFENLFLATTPPTLGASSTSQSYTFSLLGINYLNPSDDAFVENIYTSVLGRSSDPLGKAFWISALKAGVNRAELLNSFFKAASSTPSIDSISATNTIQLS